MTRENLLGEVRGEYFPAWMAAGNCRGLDPEIFFPSNLNGEVATAKSICNSGCPVRDQCLEHAMDKGERYGIWGGTSERERRRLRRTWRKRNAA